MEPLVGVNSTHFSVSQIFLTAANTLVNPGLRWTAMSVATPVLVTPETTLVPEGKVFLPLVAVSQLPVADISNSFSWNPSKTPVGTRA